jgi:hypothetical protein
MKKIRIINLKKKTYTNIKLKFIKINILFLLNINEKNF